MLYNVLRRIPENKHLCLFFVGCVINVFVFSRALQGTDDNGAEQDGNFVKLLRNGLTVNLTIGTDASIYDRLYTN